MATYYKIILIWDQSKKEKNILIWDYKTKLWLHHLLYAGLTLPRLTAGKKVFHFFFDSALARSYEPCYIPCIVNIWNGSFSLSSFVRYTKFTENVDRIIYFKCDMKWARTFLEPLTLVPNLLCMHVESVGYLPFS